ncbi:MAG: hypothetical protein A3K60_01685 [Euryarchaeota archaeon RBG_19FT_COMBO_56_21]|nr:MAG: hypothetical protein A3K60_01685 [Euryarchaeota archaeon RBG_19FT_COMBO_56_21]
MDNRGIAEVFDEIADLLDLQGVAFKPVAYRRAARNIESMEEDISDLAARNTLEDIPGVGKAMAKKIEELVRTGKLGYLDELRSEVPKGLVELLRVPDVGPKTAVILFKELGIASVEQLKEAATNHKLRGIKGFGEKTEERMLQGIQALESKGRRMLLGQALPVAETFVEYLKRVEPLDMVSVAGSLRRGKETVGDIDILVGDDQPAKVMDAFVGYPDVADVLAKGPTKSSVRLKNGLQVDIRVVETRSWGAALNYFTGSKEHNVELRRLGVSMGLKLNEYGLFQRVSDRTVAGATEEEVYKALGLRYVEPELRENSGEIAASREGHLPKLVSADDIRGDFHVHTEWTDGQPTIDEVVENAIARGYEFVGITDHSESLKFVGGLDEQKLRKQIDAVRKVQDRVGNKIRVLAGSEVDIRSDGSLDFSRKLLEELDVVIASVHSRFKMEKPEMTDRVVTAVSSGRMDILGHPTGRLIGERPGYELDLDRIFEAAKSTGVCMEINSFIDRLDLGDINCRKAKDAGVVMAIGTDAHRLEQMAFMRYGVITARRGWLEPRDVLNTVHGKDLTKRLRRRRS